MSLLEKIRAAKATRTAAMPKPVTIEGKFEAFHAANPEVYRSLVADALTLRHRGIKRWSINGLFEVLRWKKALETKGDEFRLNNNFRAYYARMMMDNEPILEGFFETRVQK